MYLQLLKELYYRERKKLEEMRIYKEEAKLKILQLQEGLATAAEGDLTTSVLLGRADISEEIKDSLLRDRDKADEVEDRLKAIIGDELSLVEKEKKEESRSAFYSPTEFAEYLFQLEKVCAIERELENNRLFAEAAYDEQREVFEKKEKQEVEE